MRKISGKKFKQFLRKSSTWIAHNKWWVVGVVVLVIVLTAIMPLRMSLAAHGEVYSTQDVPKHDVAIVFGAGALPDGTPTNYLESRLLTAIQLYRTGKAKIIIVSGDNSSTHYDEPSVMRRYLIAHGVPSAKIVADHAGYNTYDSCWRVHNIFGVNDAILVTHGYHLSRALFTCNVLGLKSVGVKADRAGANFSKNYLAREVLSQNKAAVELLFRPKPAVAGKFEDSVLRALML